MEAHMTPPVPFGAPVKKGIFSHFEILEVVSKESQKLEKPLSLNVGLPESGYSIEFSENQALVSFTYALDDDLEAANGRLLLQDTFQMEMKSKKLLSFARKINTSSAESFWLASAARLNALKHYNAKNPLVQKFFREVVLNLDLNRSKEDARGEEVEVQRAQGDLDKGIQNLSLPMRQWMADFQTLATLPEVSSKSFIKENTPNVFERRSVFSSLSRTQRMLDFQARFYVENATSPELLFPFMGGSLAFQLGRAYGASFAFRSVHAARLFSTGVGLMFEAPAFELSYRVLQAFETGSLEMEGFGAALPHHYLTFGLFRSVNILTPSPLATFGALHGMNEWQREGSVASDESYIQRVVKDALLFSQLSFASQLTEVALVRTLSGQHENSEVLFRTELSAYSQMQKNRSQAEVLIRRGIQQDDAQIHFPSQLRTIYLNPEKTQWQLAAIQADHGYYPEVPFPEVSSSLRIYKNEEGRYFLQRDEQRSFPNASVEYYDAKNKAWQPLHDDILSLSHGLQIRVDGNKIYQIHFRNAEGVPSVPQIYEAPPRALSFSSPIPLAFLPELNAKPVLATALSTENPGVAREMRSHLFIPKFGEVSAFTQVGLDKHVLRGDRSVAVNEDAMGLLLDAKGNPVFILCDGMGGYEAGEIASKVGVEVMTHVLRTNENASLADAAFEAHGQIQAQGKGQSVMEALRIFPDASVEHVSAGDARLWLIRRSAAGEYRIYEPRIPDTAAAFLRERGVIPSTLAMNAHHWSNVRSGLGGKDALRLVEALEENGNYQLFHQSRLKINQGTARNPRWEELRLQEGDELLLMSDGVANILDPLQLLGMHPERNPVSANLNTVDHLTLESMKLFNWAFEARIPESTKVQIPDGFIHAGRYIDGRGKIYEPGAVPDEWNFVAYVMADNATAIWYRHNPNRKVVARAAEPVLPPPGAVVSTVPILPPTQTPIVSRSTVDLRVMYDSRVENLNLTAAGLRIGKAHQASLFTSAQPWIEAEHCLIEALPGNSGASYKVTALSEGGLWLENQQSGKKRVFKILKKGESAILNAEDYELKFRKSPEEWDESLFLHLPVLPEALRQP